MGAYEDEYNQIVIDVKRTTPTEVFKLQKVKNMLTRVLFIWQYKHPASGYVQGINDLAAILMYVFILEQASENDSLIEELTDESVAQLSENQILIIESDTLGCLNNLTESIQTNYTDG